MADFVTLELACRCRQLTVAVDVPSSSLPLPLTICHCDTCSSVSGQLCATICAVPEGSTPTRVKGEAKGYKTSATIERFFCETCGTSVYQHASDTSPPTVYFNSGAFTQGEVTDENIPVCELKEHIFVGDTKDGGLRDWMITTSSWEGWADSSKAIEAGHFYGGVSGLQEEDDNELHCACKCKGVKFSISRPQQGSNNWEDPTEAETAAIPVAVEQSEDWWKPGGGTRYNAFLCACNDCRFSSGNDISAWAVIPKNNFRVDIAVTPENAKALEAATPLRAHESSPGTIRQFCGTCGATLGFFNEKMPNVINVSVGLMQGKNGSRCEDWLEWQRNGIGHENLAQSKNFISSLSNGYSYWNTLR